MARFVVADLNVRGEVALKADYTYELLEQLPGAAELIGAFSGAFWRSPEEFDVILPVTGGAPVTLRWRASAATAGIATLREREPPHAPEGQPLAPEEPAVKLLSVTLLASGLDADADTITLNAFQQHLLRSLHDSGYEPAFDLQELTARPLVASIHFSAPAQPAARPLFAIADRCLGAAYFRRLGV